MQQCLDPSQMSLFFVNALADPARQFFLTHCSSRMTFGQIVSTMQRSYNSETRKLQLQPEMDSMELSSFMHKHKLSNFAEGLAKLLDCIDVLAPQLPKGFGDDQHKARYLRRAVMRYDWAQQPISQLTTARYTFTQFITALNESLQLQEEISRAKLPEMHYGQYIVDPRDLRHNKYRFGDKYGSNYSPKRNYQPSESQDHSRSPNRYAHRTRSQGRLPRNRINNSFRHSRARKPRLRNKRFCFGCGSPDHILSDRKCTPTLDAIRNNMVEHIGCNYADAAALAQQFLTLHSSPIQINDDNPRDTPRREAEQSTKVSFQESLYLADERDTLESHISNGFKEDTFYP